MQVAVDHMEADHFASFKKSGAFEELVTEMAETRQKKLRPHSHLNKNLLQGGSEVAEAPWLKRGQSNNRMGGGSKPLRPQLSLGPGKVRGRV
jgi:hypothetical protein